MYVQIAIDVGALFGMLRQTIRMRNDTFFVRTFTDACEKESLMQVLYVRYILIAGLIILVFAVDTGAIRIDESKYSEAVT